MNTGCLLDRYVCISNVYQTSVATLIAGPDIDDRPNSVLMSPSDHPSISEYHFEEHPISFADNFHSGHCLSRSKSVSFSIGLRIGE